MRPENDDRLEDLDRARRLAQGYVAGEVDFAPFFDGLGSILGTSFDGLESQLHDLPDAVQREVRFYSEWTGGEWGETKDRFPTLDGWEYGESTEPYGWIDQAAYKRSFSEAFSRLELVALNRGAA